MNSRRWMRSIPQSRCCLVTFAMALTLIAVTASAQEDLIQRGRSSRWIGAHPMAGAPIHRPALTANSKLAANESDVKCKVVPSECYPA